jgi:hypothetical protein
MIRTEADVAEATRLIAQLKGWRAARAEAERIVQAGAHGKNGEGLTIKLSDAIVATIKRMRIAECDAAIAAHKRRAAQISLTLSE